MRLCWQMLAPPQSLQVLLMQLCSQMLAPPQSLQLCLRLSPASGAFSPCSNASSACAAGVTRPCSALREPVIVDS